jgi:hypothetical protein
MIWLRGPRFLGMFFIAMRVQLAFVITLAWISNTFPRPLGKLAAIIDIAIMIVNCSNSYGSYLCPAKVAP